MAEQSLVESLRRITRQELEQGARYAVMPLFACFVGRPFGIDFGRRLSMMRLDRLPVEIGISRELPGQLCGERA